MRMKSCIFKDDKLEIWNLQNSYSRSIWLTTLWKVNMQTNLNIILSKLRIHVNFSFIHSHRIKLNANVLFCESHLRSIKIKCIRELDLDHSKKERITTLFIWIFAIRIQVLTIYCFEDAKKLWFWIRSDNKWIKIWLSPWSLYGRTVNFLEI